MWLCRVVELQSKLDDSVVDRRSLADSTSSPVDDELRDINDTDRLPAFRPSLPPPLPPPPFFGYRQSPRFVPPFYGRQPPPRSNQIRSPPHLDVYRGDPYDKGSPQAQEVSPFPGRRPVSPRHYRSAPQPDNYREDRFTGRSPPPRGNSPPYYERRPSPAFDDPHRDEQYGRPSPRAGEDSRQRNHGRQWYSRPERQQIPPAEDSSHVPSGSSRERSYPHYSSPRNVVGADGRPRDARSPASLQSPADDDDYPTY